MERMDVSEFTGQDPTTDPAPGAVGAVLEEAKEQARSVAESAVEQTKGVFANIGSDLSKEANAQKLRMAKGLEEFSTELNEVALNGTGRVPSLAGEAAERTRSLSRWLENTDTSDMLRSVEDFGRRRPVVFILGSTVAGILAGRLTRGIIDDRSPGADATDTPTPNTEQLVDVRDSAPLDTTGMHPTGSPPGSTYGPVS